LTLEPGPTDVTITEPFVNRALFRLIVLTCNTNTEALSTAPSTSAATCARPSTPASYRQVSPKKPCAPSPGANYDNLPPGHLHPSVELPDEPLPFP
jgi:hypothetical protein